MSFERDTAIDTTIYSGVPHTVYTATTTLETGLPLYNNQGETLLGVQVGTVTGDRFEIAPIVPTVVTHTITLEYVSGIPGAWSGAGTGDINGTSIVIDAMTGVTPSSIEIDDGDSCVITATYDGGSGHAAIIVLDGTQVATDDETVTYTFTPTSDCTVAFGFNIEPSA